MSANEPILEDKMIGKERFIVYGGLHSIRGNHAPYFTLTYWAYEPRRKNSTQRGGAGHDEILRHFPKYSDLAALHLADINGMPMYAVENGWYFYGGTKWAARNNEYLAHHLRISIDEAEKLDFDNKEEFAAYCKTQESRWKKEADDCIAKHNLAVFGDI